MREYERQIFNNWRHLFPKWKACIMNKKKKQKWVSQSSTEVEYVAASVAANATWLRELLREGCADLNNPNPL
jgi:hypothetical protein